MSQGMMHLRIRELQVYNHGKFRPTVIVYYDASCGVSQGETAAGVGVA